ncbi:MAG: NADH-quinone oxidoreductase subunit L [Chloroflexi bacterium]|nr:NADH-quinone oxidoreductase subunit L [Chloroflexota bacterium]
MLELLWLVPALPLLGSVVSLFFGRRLPKALAGTIASGAVLGAFVVALLAVLEFVAGDTTHPFQQHLFPWIAWGEGRAQVLVAEAGLLLDPLSSVMVLVVTGVGFLIHLYSMGYMAHDPSYPRFFTYLNLFAFSMLVLVLANNFLFMFVGWELVGLCSYLLIGFWFTRPSAASAGKKAFVVNRVGDWGFLVALLLIWTTFGTFQFFADPAVATTGGVLDDPGRVIRDGSLALAIALLLFVGAVGKSAQVPLYVWLPDAMEGPTPVSALIHAATMVTAGIYMVARVHTLYELAPASLAVVATIGALTAIFAASIGLVQTDIKRVLAYSTVSQLGYMFLALGAGAFAAGIFHLMTHAFFKALLFLGAGSVIHALSDEQDLRRMGGLFSPLKVTALTFLAGWLAIIGFPGFSGFFSKDLILAKTLERGLEDPWYLVLYAVALLTVAMTAFYMSRLVFLAFFGRHRGADEGLMPAEARAVPEHEPAAAAGAVATHQRASPVVHASHNSRAADREAHGAHGAHGSTPHESPWIMLIALIVLALLSIGGGWVGIPPFMVGAAGHESPFEAFLAPSVAAHGAAEAHGALEATMEWVATGASVVMAGIGVAIAAALYLAGTPSPADFARRFRQPYLWLLNKWYVDELYQALIAHPGARLAAFLAAFDLGVVDGAVNGIARLSRGTGAALRSVQSGYVRGYAVTMLIGAFAILAFWAFRG